MNMHALACKCFWILATLTIEHNLLQTKLGPPILVSCGRKGSNMSDGVYTYYVVLVMIIC